MIHVPAENLKYVLRNRGTLHCKFEVYFVPAKLVISINGLYFSYIILRKTIYESIT